MIRRLIDTLMPWRRRAREHAELTAAVERATERRRYCQSTAAAARERLARMPARAADVDRTHELHAGYPRRHPAWIASIDD